MDTIIINLKNGGCETRVNVFNVIISGNHLIVTTKKTEELNDTHYVIATNEVFSLADIINYTTKTKTTVYGN
jgi:hypothetical protein